MHYGTLGNTCVRENPWRSQTGPAPGPEGAAGGRPGSVWLSSPPLPPLPHGVPGVWRPSTISRRPSLGMLPPLKNPTMRFCRFFLRVEQGRESSDLCKVTQQMRSQAATAARARRLPVASSCVTLPCRLAGGCFLRDNLFAAFQYTIVARSHFEGLSGNRRFIALFVKQSTYLT